MSLLEVVSSRMRFIPRCLPVPIVHAGSKSMVYVCESAWFTVVDLARDDIVVDVLIYQSMLQWKAAI